ncbi:10735_t:CDS:2 [Cetraspora pellucida]|uniref:10735_t:CDS:1 n=1 Tax=Cetraspora pellucida TaxID=1433469 RepID=A0A9N9BVR1_9GLOM|nr:10735_t:CDS:2 [Cetraspora pellucida]
MTISLIETCDFVSSSVLLAISYSVSLTNSSSTLSLLSLHHYSYCILDVWK